MDWILIICCLLSALAGSLFTASYVAFDARKVVVELERLKAELERLKRAYGSLITENKRLNQALLLSRKNDTPRDKTTGRFVSKEV